MAAVAAILAAVAAAYILGFMILHHILGNP